MDYSKLTPDEVEELASARSEAGLMSRVNKRLLSKELSKKLFKLNTEEIFNNEGILKPENYDSIIDEILDMENVHIALTPCDDHFDKQGNWVSELPTITERSLVEKDIIKSVQKYLNMGAVVYLYNFYSMKQFIIAPGDEKSKDTNTYWWRIIVKKDS